MVKNSIKCPKCGSYNIIRYEKEVNIDTCEDCDTIVQFYNKRLDKVLSWFEKVHSNNYNCEINKLLNINYSNKEFNLISYGERCSTYEFVVISLNTVESILKDLEE